MSEDLKQEAVWIDPAVLDNPLAAPLPGFCNARHIEREISRRADFPDQDLTNAPNPDLEKLAAIAARDVPADIKAKLLLAIGQAGKAGEVADTSPELKVKIKAVAASRLRVMGRTAFDEGDYDLALSAFTGLCKLDPEHPWAWKYRRKCVGLAEGFGPGLRAMDGPNTKRRLLITGCGRSGTWLMTTMMACFADIVIVPKETDIGNFAWISAQTPTILLKRTHDLWQFFGNLPPELGLIHMVRHPFAVLTSSHLGTAHHVKPKRYAAEMEAMFNHIENRPDSLVVRYESLLESPEVEQARIAELFGLESLRPFSRFHEAPLDIPVYITDSMRKLRPIDPKAAFKWRSKPEEFEYLAECMARYPDIFERVSKTFGYDLNFPIHGS